MLDHATEQAESTYADDLWTQQNCGSSQLEQFASFISPACETSSYTDPAAER
jgi:hypothetical protein